jgi:hypothetical protein
MNLSEFDNSEFERGATSPKELVWLALRVRFFTRSFTT